jgi:hypothetical protein
MNRRYSIKNVCIWCRQHSGDWIPQNWLLHFTRKFNLAIQSRFPDFRICVPSPLLMQDAQWAIENSLLCYSDRIAQDLHLIPSSDCHAEDSQHFICSLWNYTTFIVPSPARDVNVLFTYQGTFPKAQSSKIIGTVFFTKSV